MLNYIWLAMLVLGFAVGIMNGRIEAVTQAAIDSASTAVQLAISLLGVMCLWTGLMNIANKSGLVRLISRLVKPVIRFLFPDIPRDHTAIGAMVMNLVANFMGMGNAATPLGIKAMTELQKLNHDKKTATKEMIMFIILNTAAIQLVPALIISVRSAAGSANPGEIISPIWFASSCAALTGISVVKILSAVKK